jgi:hypothetical protein
VALDRRRRRSDVTEVALGFYLDTLTERFDLLGAVLLDPSGAEVAGVGDWTLLRLLAAAGLAQSRGVPRAARWLDGASLATELYTLQVELAMPLDGEPTRPIRGWRVRRTPPRPTDGRGVPLGEPRPYLLSAAACRGRAETLQPLALPEATGADLQRIFRNTHSTRANA